MNLYLATGNPHKAAELHTFFAKLLDRGTYSVHTAAEIGGMPPVVEDAGSFVGNATLKAKALQAQVPLQGSVLADDSGLEVDALQGAPGVFSARYAGSSATDNDNTAKLLNELNGVPATARTARFVCCLLLLTPEEKLVFTGFCRGRIASAAAGDKGFGYDPVFIPEGYTQTLGQLGPNIKERVSHRAQAFKQLAKWLSHQMSNPPPTAHLKRA